ncbi:NAD-dependent epimerase/dehydratase family protein [Tsukamurella sp. 8F]|uniref:NAD-dependent epimerase/dehydratase family protein n=1 Tax=unclassified Tsukamurella TaxID=2633480 RepID=UPI0023B9E7D1|nr:MULTISPECIES: NAD-dependent epimerase/dehydratase family protein [unclassified Tsukamurella]MDF0529349.1 NAD-dependent epimerase/dehydratase family protein [Tsukamurella sp. 8J]MDF0587144.1 NAD-dependent epimerase/dehydratase family protein [Tsukamurella sp. 8F]
MQTILGANGQIAVELARELGRAHTDDLRLVSRNPRKVNEADEVVSADLLDAGQTARAVAGSEIVYFTAGLPADTALWEARFPTMLRNALAAARAAGAKFAYFDNTYMYPQDDHVQTEETPFAPVGRKGRVRADMATMVLEETVRGDVPALIARAPEFYGPGRTQGFTNSLIIDRIKTGKRPLVPVRADRRRTLIWTPDASRALATLGNTPDAYGQTWHLPVDDDRPTYREFASMATAAFGAADRYTVVPEWALIASGIFDAQAREIRELLARYRYDNLFDASKFAERFPDFEVTTYRAGLDSIRVEADADAAAAES